MNHSILQPKLFFLKARLYLSLFFLEQICHQNMCNVEVGGRVEKELFIPIDLKGGVRLRKRGLIIFFWQNA